MNPLSNNEYQMILDQAGKEAVNRIKSIVESIDNNDEAVSDIVNDVSQLKEDYAELSSQIFASETVVPNLDAFTAFAVAGNVRMCGNTTTIAGKVKEVTAKVSGTGSANLVFAHVYQDGIWFAKVDAVVPVTFAHDGIVTLKNGTDFTYDEELPAGSIVGFVSSAVKLCYYTDGTNGFNFGASVNVGDVKRFVDTQANYNHGIGMTVEKAVLADRFTALESSMENVESDVEMLKEYVPSQESVVYCADFSKTTSPTQISNMRIGGNEIFDNGKLESILFKSTGNGAVTFVLLKTEIEGLKVVAHIPVNVTGDKTEYINGVDFEYDEQIEMNMLIGAYSTEVNTYYGEDGVASMTSYNGLPEVGAYVRNDRAPYNIAIGVKVKPDVFVNNVMHNDTVIMPSGYRHYNREDETSLFATPSTLAGVVKILHSGSHNIANGSGCFVNFAAGTCGFYKNIAQETDALEVIATDTIGFQLVAGRKYRITQKKTLTGFTIEVVDSVTMDKHSFSTTNITSGEGNGFAYYVADNGITVTDFKHIAYENAEPKVLVFGDSWTAGNTLWGQKENLWVSKFIDAVDSDVFVYCMGGASSTNGMLWIEAIKDVVKPKYVVLEFGVNEYNLLMYKYKMQCMIDFIKNKWHAIPVLVQVPPTKGASGNAGIYDDINEWVANSGELYIDMCTPLTVNGDGVTRDNSLFFADETHPTAEGHDLLFKSMQICAPELYH